MIAYLRGKILEAGVETAILEAQGVGYEVYCSLTTLAELQSTFSKEVTLWIYTHVREDAFLLFGFLSQAEKQMFLSLLKVNGIGPKMAIHILSGASLDQLTRMIEEEDVKGLSKLPKVGKAKAEQMILTLKGKLVVAPTVAAGASSAKASRAVPHREISSALINLGFRSQDVDKVVGEFPKDIDLQEGIRRGLSALTSI